MERCSGVTKRGTPCNISWGLNQRGYCKYHDPVARQCRGIARATGQRCKVMWDLDSEGYCRYHVSQSRQLEQCIATTQSGQRCRQMIGIDTNGYCAVHHPTDHSAPLCQDRLCTNNAKPGYDYCAAAHDPQFASSYSSPHRLNAKALRDSCEDQVVTKYSTRDLYHNDILDLKTPGFVEMDHILEKQCFSYAFRFLDCRDEREDVDFVASIVREEIVNELPNLCLTRTTTNRIKGAAVWKFLDDCLTGHVGATDTFTGYLLAESRDGMRLGRKTTRVIAREMGTALKYCQRQLSEQGETPVLDDLSSQLQALYVKMQFRTNDPIGTPPTDETSKSALKADAKPFVPKIDTASDNVCQPGDLPRRVSAPKA